MNDPAIWLHDVVVRRVTLPAELNDAITHKLTQEQNAQTYQFRLEANSARPSASGSRPSVSRHSTRSSATP